MNASNNGPDSPLDPFKPNIFVFSRWNKWALSRGKRELKVSSNYPTGLANVQAGPAQTIIQPQDVKGASRSTQAR